MRLKEVSIFIPSLKDRVCCKLSQLSEYRLLPVSDWNLSKLSRLAQHYDESFHFLGEHLFVFELHRE